MLAELELGVTFCHIACARRDVRKGRLLQDAQKALSNAMAAMGKFEFPTDGVDRINAGINRLQRALEECAPES